MKKAALVVMLGFVAMYLLPLGERPLSTPDEVRYMQIPQEMIDSGDWVVPRLNGLRYFEKPVMGYWLNVLSINAFGPTRTAGRLPAALAAGFTAWAVFWLVRRSGGGKAGALAAAGVYLTFAEVLIVGTLNVLDGPFTLFVTWTLMGFWAYYTADTKGLRLGWLLFAGLAAGMAFLTKGFLAFAIPVIVIAPFLLWEKKWKQLFLCPWLPLIAAAVIILPWAILVEQREGYWHYFIFEEHLNRFAGEDAQHASPMWYFLPVILLGAMPGLIYLPAGVIGLRKDPPNKAFTRYLLCWLIVPFLFFSMSKGKLATYILPCYAPLGMLIGMGLWRYLSGRMGQLFYKTIPWLSLGPAVIAAGLIVVQFAQPRGFYLYQPGEERKFILVVSTLLLWTALGVLGGRSKQPGKALALVLVAPMFLMVALPGCLPERFLYKQFPGEFLQSQADMVAPDAYVVSDKRLVKDACWYFGRSDVDMLEGAGELQWGVEKEDSKHRLLMLPDLMDRLKACRAAGRDVVILGEVDRVNRWKEHLPAPDYQVANQAYEIMVYKGKNK